MRTGFIFRMDGPPLILNATAEEIALGNQSEPVLLNSGEGIHKCKATYS